MLLFLTLPHSHSCFLELHRLLGSLEKWQTNFWWCPGCWYFAVGFPVPSLCYLHGPGAVLSTQQQRPATASSHRHCRQQSVPGQNFPLGSGLQHQELGRKRQQLVSPLTGVEADTTGLSSQEWYPAWVTALGACGHSFLLVLSLTEPYLLTPSDCRAWLTAPAPLLPKAALFLLSLLPLLVVKTLACSPLWHWASPCSHLPICMGFFCFICLFFPFHFSWWTFMLLAFYLICGCPAACYASHAASRLAVSGAPALCLCKVPFSCESDWTLLCNYSGRRGRTSVFEAPDQFGDV